MEPLTGASRRWYRTPAVAWYHGLAGLLFFVLATDGLFVSPSDGKPNPQSASFVVVGLLINVAVLALFSRAATTGVRLDGKGVLVRNVRRSVRVGWADVQDFEVARRSLWPLIGIVRLTDGNVIPCYGIQRLLATGNKVNSRIHTMLQSMNATLTEQRRRLGLPTAEVDVPQVGALTRSVRSPTERRLHPHDLDIAIRLARWSRRVPILGIAAGLLALGAAVVAGASWSAAFSVTCAAVVATDLGLLTALHVVRRAKLS